MIGPGHATPPRTLDTTSSTPDACRVTGRRTAARGNAVPLSFGQALGMQRADLTVTCLAVTSGGTPQYGIVGLNYFNMNSGSAFTGTYNSSTGTFTTGAASNDGSIACNSNMNLNGSASVGGTIYYYTSSPPNGATNYDAKTRMSTAISTPAVPSAGSYAASNSNASVGLPTSGANYNQSSGNVTCPAGTYVLNTFNLTGGTLTFSGPVTLYVYGNFGLSSGATVNTYQNKPSNLQVKVCVASGVNLSMTGKLYAQVNAPTSPLNLSGSGSLVGSVMCSGIDMSSSGGIYYDIALGANGGSSGGTISYAQ